MATFTKVNQGKAVRAMIRLPKLPAQSKNFSKKKYGTLAKANAAAKEWAAAREAELRTASPGAASAAHERTFYDVADVFCQVRCGFRLNGEMPKEALATFRNGGTMADGHGGPNRCTPMDIGRDVITGKNLNGPVGQLDWWVRYFGKTRLSKINSEMILEGLRQLDDGKRSPATINRYQSVVSTAFKLCLISTGLFPWLASNPAPTIKRREQNRREVVLTAKQKAKLLPACKKSNWSDLYLVVMIGIATGARQANIMGLRWSRLDLKSGRVDIPAHEMKAGKAWATWITGEALDLLRERKKALKKSKVTKLGDTNKDFVFPAPLVEGPQEFDSKRRDAWNAALEAAGIERSIDPNDRVHTGFRFHDLRHTFMTKMAAKHSANNQQLKQVLGVSADATVARYANVTIDDVRSLFD